MSKSTLPLVVHITCPEAQDRRLAFVHTPVRIGRSPLNDLQLDEPFISRWEGVLRFSDAEVTYFRVGRTNATFLNGREVNPDTEVPVSEGHELRIGPMRFRFLRMHVSEELIQERKMPAFGAAANQNLESTVYLSGSENALQPREPGPYGRSAPQLSTPAPTPEADPAPRPPANLPGRAEPVPRGPAAELMPVAHTPSPTPEVSPVDFDAAAKRLDGAGPFQSTGSTSSPVLPSLPQSPAQAPPHSQAPARSQSPPQGVEDAYAQYRSAWDNLRVLLETQLEQTPQEAREAEATRLQKRLPQIVRERDFRKLLKRLGLQPLRSGDPDVSDWVRRFARGVFPPGVRLDSRMTLERIGQTLHVLGQALIEIRSGQDQVRAQMALARAAGRTLLENSPDAKLLLAYLLNPAADPESRGEELRRSVADLAMHEVALVKAAVEGVRGVLKQLSPETVEAHCVAEESSLFSKLRGGRAERLWNRYVELHESLFEEDRFTRQFFGHDFSQAYFSMMGEPAKDTAKSTGTRKATDPRR